MRRAAQGPPKTVGGSAQNRPGTPKIVGASACRAGAATYGVQVDCAVVASVMRTLRALLSVAFLEERPDGRTIRRTPRLRRTPSVVFGGPSRVARRPSRHERQHPTPNRNTFRAETRPCRSLRARRGSPQSRSRRAWLALSFPVLAGDSYPARFEAESAPCPCWPGGRALPQEGRADARQMIRCHLSVQ